MSKFLKDWKECIYLDWPVRPVTERTREVAYQMARRGYRADVRTATGRVYTDAEFEARQKRILATELP